MSDAYKMPKKLSYTVLPEYVVITAVDLFAEIPFFLQQRKQVHL
jgi:hypothetical protein